MTPATLNETFDSVLDDSRQKQKLADQILFAAATEGVDLSPEERQYLRAVGRLTATGYATEKEVETLVARFTRIGELRSHAGLGGAYEASVADRDRITADNTERIRELDSQIDALSKARADLEIETLRAEKQVAAMESARSHLTDRQFIPNHVTEEYRTQYRQFAESDRREWLDAQTALHDATLAIEADKWDEYRRGDFARKLGLSITFVGPDDPWQHYLADPEKWPQYIAAQRQLLHDGLSAQVESAKKHVDDVEAELNTIFDFWLQVDPWAETEIA